MITTFHSTGTKPVTPNSPLACRTAAMMPVRASSRMIGNITCDRRTVSALSSGESPSANHGMKIGASTIASSVIAPRTMTTSPMTAPTTRSASFLRPPSMSWV